MPFCTALLSLEWDIFASPHSHSVRATLEYLGPKCTLTSLFQQWMLCALVSCLLHQSVCESVPERWLMGKINICLLTESSSCFLKCFRFSELFAAHRPQAVDGETLFICLAGSLTSVFTVCFYCLHSKSKCLLKTKGRFVLLFIYHAMLLI